MKRCSVDVQLFVQMLLAMIEFAFNEKNALLCESKSGEALAKNPIKLIENDELRYIIANEGYKTIKKYTLGKSI